MQWYLRPESRGLIGVGFCQKAFVTAATEPLPLLSLRLTDPSIVWKFSPKRQPTTKATGPRPPTARARLLAASNLCSSVAAVWHAPQAIL